MVIGITGQFASGKSTVAKMLAKFCRATIIDADKIGHSVLSDAKVKEQLINYFGNEILKNGSISRKSLAKKAFLARKNHEALCRITHPVLVDKILKKLKICRAKSSKGIVIIDAAVLIEMGLLKYIDKLIVIKIKRGEQIRRCRDKWKLSVAQINKRIKLQIPASRLFKKADFIIDNSNHLNDTRKQIEKIRSVVWQKMKK